MKILFLHGWHSVPGGVKPRYLKDHGHEVYHPTLDDESFEAAVAMAQAEFDLRNPDVIVGCSRGGAVALNMRSGATPLVLLCPAWKRWGAVRHLKRNAVILHSRQDDVIPFADSEELVEISGLPSETLIEVGIDHRLADEGSLPALLWACEVLSSCEQLPWLEEQSESAADVSRKDGPATLDEVSYVCDACGEEIIIPLDLTEGSSQQYVEDCPVCCRANTIHVEIDEEGNARVRAEPEQDYD